MDSAAPPSIFAERPVLTAVAVAAVSLAPHCFLPPASSLAFAAIVLGAIAGIYFGFAVVRGSNLQQQIEFGVTFLFMIAALLGVAVSPWFLPAAYFAHGVWDFAHHHEAHLPLVSIPRWYVPWCVAIDGIVGIGLIALWSWNGVL